MVHQDSTSTDEAGDPAPALSLSDAFGNVNLPSAEDDLDIGPQFDPDTLANLAALSRITNDEDDPAGNIDEGSSSALVVDDPDQDFTSLIIRQTAALTREQVQEFVDNLGTVGQNEEGLDEESGQLEAEVEVEERTDDERDREMETEDGSQPGDEDYREPKAYYADGKLKRRRNRTVLSCTECHRRCDRNIPCSRCIKRGVPSMCRMEAPVMPQRKKKKPNDDVPINYELGLRVQALESLIRSGSNMDAEAASNAAMETILHATRAANSGQQEAANALAQLTQSASTGLGIGGMSQDAQSSLLLDVLQQLSAASMGRPTTFSGTVDVGGYSEMRDTWSSVPAASLESSVQIETAFRDDLSTSKLNVSLPGFREDNGKVFIPPTVRYAEKKLRDENILALDSLHIEGYAPFLEAGTRFGYGEDSPAVKNKRISAIQVVSTTGALRIAASFLSRFPVTTTQRCIYIPNPTTEEDAVALRDGGLEVKLFRFLDLKWGGVDWEGLREDLQLAPARSIVLLHVSGSMPTGAELTAPQWRLLTTLLQERQLIPLVIMNFQGLSSGDTNRDAQPLRFMVHEGLPVVLIQSFDAMMGLYADCPAIVSVVTQSFDDRDRVDSQLRSLARAMYAHPPPWGAHVAHSVLSDSKLYPAWLAEIKAMSDRLRSVREKLFDILAVKLKTPGSWVHLKRSSGMYCTMLLPPSQVEALTTKRHVHLLPEGCVSLGCLNAQKIDSLARSIDHIVREGIREAEEQAAQSMAMELALAAAKEQQAREEAEAQAIAEAAEAAAAREEDTLLMERSIQTAIEAQRLAEEEEKRREDEARLLEDQVRKAAERAEIARQAELILASI